MASPDKFAFVLYRPQSAGNIGAAARALKNMGFEDLRLVGRGPLNDRDAVKMAVHADDILAHATVYPDLAAALADCSIAVGTTSRRGGYRSRATALRPAAAELDALVLGLLEKDAANRPTLAQVAELLTELLGELREQVRQDERVRSGQSGKVRLATPSAPLPVAPPPEVATSATHQAPTSSTVNADCLPVCRSIVVTVRAPDGPGACAYNSAWLPSPDQSASVALGPAPGGGRVVIG